MRILERSGVLYSCFNGGAAVPSFSSASVSTSRTQVLAVSLEEDPRHHEYADENKHIMEAVAARIMELVEGRPAVGGNVVQLY